jgi:prophage tail gpP-like protein
MSRIILQNATQGKELLWRHIRIHKSLDEICHTLEAEIAPQERTKIRRHDKIEVRVENPLVRDSGGKRRITTVLVDEITASADVSKHSLRIIGRSPARDIIDSRWDETNENQNQNQKLGELLKRICKKFNIDSATFPTNKPDPTRLVENFNFDNESPWPKLIAEADNQGFILSSNEAGFLYLWEVAGAVCPGFKLTEGVNIKDVRWTENGAEQFHEYIVKGGGNTAQKPDNTCPGSRVLTINITDENIALTKLERRAETEMRRRRERRVTVSTAGWGLTDTQIKNLGDTSEKEIYWTPNTIIPISMPSLGLDDKLLIAEVEQEAGAGVWSSTITLVNRDAYL